MRSQIFDTTARDASSRFYFHDVCVEIEWMSAVIELGDAQDERLAAYRNLQGQSVGSFETDTFVVEGRWCLQRLAQSRHKILSVLVERGHESLAIEVVKPETTIYSLPGDQMRSLVGYDFHRGVLGCGRRPKLMDAMDLDLGAVPSKLALAVLGISDRENMGSIIRSATALGVTDLLIGPRTVDPYSRRSIRVSMATVFSQTIYDLSEPIQQLKSLSDQSGFRTVVTTLREATPLEAFEHDDRPVVLIVGNEADGVAESIERIATDRLTMPMKTGADSLNVAVATAIFLYELNKVTG
ncbi:MAG: RNA methyltransferase [Planctomycetota bacterium]